MHKEITGFFKIINLEEASIELFSEALTHRSYPNDHRDEEINNNERLEFLGDAVLELIVTEFLFKKYPEFPEGDLTSFRSALVRTESLADEALRLDFGEFIRMSSGEEQTGGRTRPYILANTVEAIIGAIYLDKGFEEAKNFILREICHKIEEIVEKRLDIDPKSRFQEIVQDEFKITPSYELIKDWGPDHNKMFRMGAHIGEQLVAEGEGDSKQAAQQSAAAEAIKNWDKLKKQIESANN